MTNGVGKKMPYHVPLSDISKQTSIWKFPFMLNCWNTCLIVGTQSWNTCPIVGTNTQGRNFSFYSSSNVIRVSHINLRPPTADNLFHSFMVLWEKQFFLTSNLLCPFSSMKSCPLVPVVLLPVLILKISVGATVRITA